jgi:hypothetical protein
MPDALIKGETHLSRKDKQALMEMDLSQFDAVFREGYDTDYFERDITPLYALFGIGHLVYAATYGLLYISIDEFRQKAREQGLAFHDDIDTAVYESYEMVSLRKRILLLFLAPVLALALLGLASTPFQLVFQRMLPGFIPVLSVIAGIGLFFVFGFAFALAYFMMIMDEIMYDRDEYMAEEILRITEQEGYDSVLVSCGGNHRQGIASYLEDEGWETEEEATDSPIGKILLWVDRLFGALLNPRQTIRRVYSKVRTFH